MAIPVVEFSREGYKIKKVFWLKIKCSQMNLPNLENGVVAIFFFFIEEYEVRSTLFVIDIF